MKFVQWKFEQTKGATPPENYYKNNYSKGKTIWLIVKYILVHTLSYKYIFYNLNKFSIHDHNIPIN